MRPGLPSAVFKLFGASYRPCASRTEISKRILKDIFAFPAPVTQVAFVPVKNAFQLREEGQRGKARNFMKYTMAEFADEWYYLVGDVTNILTILRNERLL